ncbi:MAG: hypothetical protein V7700_16415 [Halioglobus sp.]
MNNKQIAEQLLQDYQSGRYAFEGDMLAFRVDGLTVRCRNLQEAVQTLAAKFSKARPTNYHSQSWKAAKRRR